MELAESIKTAWAAVKESGVPEHMQEVAFKEALRSLLSTDQSMPQAEETSPREDGGENQKAPEVSTSANEDQIIAAVSEHTGVPVEKLERVFHLDNGVIKILVNHSALGDNAADKTRTTAQIITVARKVGMGYGDTDFDIIRDECQRKHFYDRGNFASKHLPNIDGFAVKGDGRKKRLEARTGGVTAFPGLIDKVLGES